MDFINSEISWVNDKVIKIDIFFKNNNWEDIAKNVGNGNIKLHQYNDMDTRIVEVGFKKFSCKEIQDVKSSQNTFFGAYRAYYKLFTICQAEETPLKNLYEDTFLKFELSNIKKKI